jgi:phosphoenolpyruvate carboxykinase (GTP)
VESVKKLTKPDKLFWCDGSDEEYKSLCELLVAAGTFIPLNKELRPNSFLARADPRDSDRDKARKCTVVCSKAKEDAGPMNNWADPEEMKKKMNKLFDGCMKGRTMYIIPFCMGPIGSPYSRFGVEITDSPYVVCHMKITTRMGAAALKAMGENEWFLKCLHSVGCPLQSGQKDVPWPCNPDNTHISIFPDDPSVWSFGSSYGANGILSKRGYALQIGSVLARKEGWLAEHCLTIGLTSPEGRKYYICAALPNGCGKTNLATLVPTIPGWSSRCISDDTTWLHIGEDGRLYAINPEAGFFDVTKGASYFTSRATMDTLASNTIFTNVALTPEGDVWWEGMTNEIPNELVDWTGQKWTPGCGRMAAHTNSRYCAPASQCPVIDPEWESAQGVPISAFVFGGKSSRLFPLVTEAFTWNHGVFLGSLISTEQTNDTGNLHVVRDPFAIGDYCGYHMGDYLKKWEELRKNLGFSAPKMFFVNWFKKDKQGSLLWPGFGENSIVLSWICRRLTNEVGKLFVVTKKFRGKTNTTWICANSEILGYWKFRHSKK